MSTPDVSFGGAYGTSDRDADLVIPEDAAAGDLLVVGEDGRLARVGSGTYAPATIWLPAEQLGAVHGSPTKGQIGNAIRGVHAWLFSDAANGYVEGSRIIPAGWTSVNVDLVWSSATTNTDVVRFAAWSQSLAEAEDLSADPGNTPVDITAPGVAARVEVDRLLSAEAVTAGERHSFGTGRAGGTSFDTQAGNVAILGLVVSKA